MGRVQKAHCTGQKCPWKGVERKERHHWLVPHSHCKQRGVQPRVTDVSGYCFHSTLLSAAHFPEFHKTALGLVKLLSKSCPMLLTRMWKHAQQVDERKTGYG